MSNQRMYRFGAALAAIALTAAACGSDDDEALAADAGDDFSVAVGESPNFDGCGSTGEITNYAWVIRETPSDMADDVDKALREELADCSFSLDASMIIDEVGDWVIELTVTDGDGATSTDTVTVTVTA